MIQVENFGLHWEGSIAWLLQGRKASNFAGLRAQSPFQNPKGMCNHLIPPAAQIPDRVHWEKFLEIFSDPLVQALLPIPHPKGGHLFFAEDPGQNLAFYLSTLSRMSSPIKTVLRPAWNFKAKELEKEVFSSNVQPLVIAQLVPKHQELLDLIGEMGQFGVRTIVACGSPDLVVQAPMKRIKTKITSVNLEELMTLPLENIGAMILRRYARREELGAPMETREDRRNRQIQERNNS
jgi:hypothetical protein